MTIDWNPLIEKCHAAAVANGWWEQPRAITSALGLITTEPAEALEWYREFKGDADSAFLPHRAYSEQGHGPYPEDYLETRDSYSTALSGWRSWKPVGIPSELADVAIRVCDLMGHMKLEANCVDGFEYEFDRSGFVAQCFVLTMKIAETQPNEEATMRVGLEMHMRVNLCGVLACVRDIAEANNIDLAAAIETKLTYNATRGHRHGGKRA